MSSSEQHPAPRVIDRVTKAISPWVRVETVTAIMPGASEPEIYHALAQADYVHVLCLHVSGNLVVVRQYRPILDQWTVELPGGLRDEGESPADTARREVEEETGLTVKSLIPLMENFADIGRLTNKAFGFFAVVDGKPGSAEIGVEASLVPCDRIGAMAADGTLAVPAHIGLLYLAGRHEGVRRICVELGLGEPPWMLIDRAASP
ncbi:NUDIX domain-containing protein [Rhizobiales bacterium GAS188]|nr:NUDIX domain-containing protein [Rhizobiales bacterium GAS188]